MSLDLRSKTEARHAIEGQCIWQLGDLRLQRSPELQSTKIKDILWSQQAQGGSRFFGNLSRMHILQNFHWIF